MTTPKDGTTKFLQQAVLVGALMTTIIGAVVYVTARLSTLETEVKHLNDEVMRLNGFMSVGERFTRQDGAVLSRKIDALEAEVRTYPPQWFRDNFEDLRNEVKSLNIQITSMEVALTRLGITLEGKKNE